MALETGTYIADLVATNPVSSDPVGRGDDHLRLLKSTILATFPNFGGRFARDISCPAGYTLLSTDNSGVLHVPVAASTTLTHTVSLPAVSSITSGFYAELHVPGPADVVILTPIGGTSIEGSATLTFGPQSGGRVFYDGTTWRVHEYPLVVGDAMLMPGAVGFEGTISVSGAAVMKSGLTVEGASTLSGATVLTTTLTVQGASTLSGAVLLSTGLTVEGASTLSGAVLLSTGLTVEGVTTLSGAAVMNSTLHVDGAASFSSTVVMDGLLNLQVGQVKFPSTQNASTDANTLDDYEEGTWTPAMTFSTVGNLSLSYSTQVGTYTKIGRLVTASAVLATATFTHTTSSGTFRLTGLPFTAGSVIRQVGVMYAASFTLSSGRTWAAVVPVLSQTYSEVIDSGTAVSNGIWTTANHTTGDNVVIRYTVAYEV